MIISKQNHANHSNIPIKRGKKVKSHYTTDFLKQFHLVSGLFILLLIFCLSFASMLFDLKHHDNFSLTQYSPESISYNTVIPLKEIPFFENDNSFVITGRSDFRVSDAGDEDEYEIYYIAPNGDDANDGSIGSPWKTFQRAFKNNSLTYPTQYVSHGDTLYMRGGIYRFDEIWFSQCGNELCADQISGTLEHPTIISSYPGEQAIFLMSENITDWVSYTDLNRPNAHIYSFNWTDYVKDNYWWKWTYNSGLAPQLVVTDTTFPIFLQEVNSEQNGLWSTTRDEITNEILFRNMNSVRINQSDMVSGDFYYESNQSDEDYGMLYVWLPDDANPSLSGLEVAFDSRIALGNQHDVVLQNFTVKFANAAASTAIVLSGNNITFDNLTLIQNAFSGLGGLCINCTVRNSNFSFNGYSGSTLMGDGTVYDSCAFQGNNYRQYSMGWGCGGMKLIPGIGNMTFRNNLFKQNKFSCGGLWFDGMEGGHLIENNVFIDDSLFLEMTPYTGTDIVTVKNNLFIGENSSYQNVRDQYGIYTGSPRYLNITHNLIYNKLKGVGLADISIGCENVYRNRILNVSVTDNVFINITNPVFIDEYSTAQSNCIFENNSIDYNLYLNLNWIDLFDEDFFVNYLHPSSSQLWTKGNGWAYGDSNSWRMQGYDINSQFVLPNLIDLGQVQTLLSNYGTIQDNGAMIDELQTIISSSMCNENNICEYLENENNCPSDCSYSNGLVAYYTFDNTLIDQSGNNHDGTGIINCTLNGFIGQSCYFNNSNSISINSIALAENASFSFYYKSNRSKQQGFFSDTTTSFRGVGSLSQPYDTVLFWGHNASTLAYSYTLSNENWTYFMNNDSMWHLYVLTKSNGYIRAYRDGALIYGDIFHNASWNYLRNSTGPFSVSNLGKFYDGTAWVYAEGYMDELKIYNRTLSKGEIELLDIPPSCVDNDNDGFGVDDGICTAAIFDCNDTDITINPDAIEICGNGVDENCNSTDDNCISPEEYNTYYMAPNGDDANDGSIGSPWKTLGRVFNNNSVTYPTQYFSHGDTLYMRGGIYRYDDTWMLKFGNNQGDYFISGFSDMPSVISSYPNERAIFYFSENITDWVPYSERSDTDIYYINWSDYIRNNYDFQWDYMRNGIGPEQVVIDGEIPIFLQEVNSEKNAAIEPVYIFSIRTNQSDMIQGDFYYESNTSDPNWGLLFVWMPDNSDPTINGLEVSFDDRMYFGIQDYVILKDFSARYANSGTAVAVSGFNNSFLNLDTSYNAIGGLGGECTNCTIKNSIMNYNGLATGVGGNGTVYENNTFDHNNYRNYSSGWHCGVKMTTSRVHDMVFRNNTFSNSVYCPGLWFDYSGGGHIIENNLFVNNSGLMIEASACVPPENKTIHVRNNLFMNTETPPDWSRSIYVSGSCNVVAENNLFLNSHISVLVGSQDCLSDYRRTLINNHFINNIFLNCSRSLQLDEIKGLEANCITNNNTGDDNMYLYYDTFDGYDEEIILSPYQPRDLSTFSPGGNYVYGDLAGWQNYGHDLNSIVYSQYVVDMDQLSQLTEANFLTQDAITFLTQVRTLLSSSICDNDGICEWSENSSNCNSDCDLTNDLVAYYAFNNNLDDSSGLNNDGIGNFDCTSPGVLDNACYFDGTKSINLTNNISLSSNLSLSFYLKSDVLLPMGFFSHNSSSFPGITSTIYSSSIDPREFLWKHNTTIRAYTYQNQIEQTNLSYFLINDTLWHHYIITKSDTMVRGYRDGELMLSIFFINSSLQYISRESFDTTISKIGSAYCMNCNNPVYAKGYMDEVRIFNRTLSKGEITELYNLIDIGQYCVDADDDGFYLDDGNCVSELYDCNDTDSSINYDTIEICNLVDDNCDDTVDEGVTTTFYRDSDSDTFGNASSAIQACTAPVGYVLDFADCNDGNGNINLSAIEVCNGYDDNCVLGIDESDVCSSNSYYCDIDGDEYTAAIPSGSCSEYDCIPIGCADIQGDDCNDTNVVIYPDAIESCNNLDDDCDSTVDENLTRVALITNGSCSGNTQYCSIGIWNDNATNYNPTTETCNGLDDDCDGLVDNNLIAPNQSCAAGMGICRNWGIQYQSCNGISGWSVEYGTCSVSAGLERRTDESCNNLDDDCDGPIDENLTRVALITNGSCSGNTQYCSVGIWNDNATNYNPTSETCNSLDDDCNGIFDENVKITYYNDSDSDLFGNASSTTQACTTPFGYVLTSGDCNDGNVTIKPTASETCNLVDDNCDNQIDENVKITYYNDSDNDLFGNASSTTQACTTPVGYVLNSEDCNDGNVTIKPTASEICDSVDNDCDSIIDENSCALPPNPSTSGSGGGGASIKKVSLVIAPVAVVEEPVIVTDITIVEDLLSSRVRSSNSPEIATSTINSNVNDLNNNNQQTSFENLPSIESPSSSSSLSAESQSLSMNFLLIIVGVIFGLLIIVVVVAYDSYKRGTKFHQAATDAIQHVSTKLGFSSQLPQRINPAIMEYVKRQIVRNVPIPAIKEMMKKYGWKDETIQEVFLELTNKYVHNSSNINPAIVDYVKRQIARNVPITAIKDIMKQYGWKDETIQEIFKLSAVSQTNLPLINLSKVDTSDSFIAPLLQRINTIKNKDSLEYSNHINTTVPDTRVTNISSKNNPSPTFGSAAEVVKKTESNTNKKYSP